MGRVNDRELDWEEYEHGPAAFRRKRLAATAGSDALGCTEYELPPGRRSWPYHFHTANEEAMYVLAGAGTLRLAGETLTVQPGDYVAFPADEGAPTACATTGTSRSGTSCSRPWSIPT